MLRLFDPTQQFQDRSGALLVGGSVTVYLDGTDDLAEVYNDEQRAMQQPVPIDSDGRVAGLFVKDDKTYWMKVNDPSGNTLFTITDMTPSSTPGSIDTLLEKFVRVDASQTFTDEEKAKGRENLGIDQVLNNYVRVDAAQEFDDEKLKQGRDNIKAQKYVGGPGSFVDVTTVDQNDMWANIGSIDLAALGIGGRYSNCFTNISLSLEVTVYNTGSADSEIVEHGRFNINVHAEPSNGKWIVDAGWAEYKGRGNTRLVELMRVSRNNGNGGAIDKITLYAKVPEESTFYANAINVSVLNNYGSIHKNDSWNSTKAIVAPWTLSLGLIFENFFGKNENVVAINRYVASRYDSYVDYSTFSGAKFELLDNYSAFAGYASANTRGNIPIAKNNEGVIAQTIKSTDSEAKIATMTEKSIRIARFNSGGATVLNHARLQSVGFNTPDIDIDTVGSYLIGEDYIYPTQGQTRSISVFFEVVSAGVEQFYVNASWLRLGSDDPKEFKICATYYDTNGTVATWNGTKVLTNEEERIFVTFYDVMHKLEIDFISTDGERWYHFEYFKNGNRSRMVEY